MSEKLISRSPDLQRLRDEGYEIEVRHGFLIIHSVPYVTPKGEVHLGKVVSELTINNDRTQTPDNHQVWFAGEHPSNRDGSIMAPIRHSTATQVLCEGLEVHHRFSCKPKPDAPDFHPPAGYADYHAKVTRYIEIIEAPTSRTARTFKPIRSPDDDSVFVYTDSASSRAAIANVSRKLALDRLDIVGLGGSGAYVLDLVAKTHAREIHLHDGDFFLQHNAFRAPGAASIEDLEKKLRKVEYFAEIYSAMRRGVVPHSEHIDDENISILESSGFVFICVDKPSVRKLIVSYLLQKGIPFVDVGMELELIEEQQCLIGTCRVTAGSPAKNDHLSRCISFDNRPVDDLYATNIQVADLNALCAVLAVIRWKKHCGFYQDCYGEHESAYAINAHQLTRDEMTKSGP